MKTLKVDLDSRITEALGSYIEQTLPQWFKHVTHNPISYDVFSAKSVPQKEEDIHKGGSADAISLPEYEDSQEIRYVRRLLKNADTKNALVYSPLSAMYWHTNSDSPGLRTYYSFSLGRSVFKYRDPNTGEIYEDWDNKGWTARQFNITEERPFWHCVWTSARRFSFGFSDST